MFFYLFSLCRFLDWLGVAIPEYAKKDVCSPKILSWIKKIESVHGNKWSFGFSRMSKLLTKVRHS